MKAMILKSTGDVDSLQFVEMVDPTPKAGEVRVRLKAAALNRRDISIRKRDSSHAMLPLIPGSDGAGIVDELGAGVEDWVVGQAVVVNPALNWGPSLRQAGPDFRILGGPDQGTYAEKTVVPVENIFPKPDHLSFQEAAACPVGMLTAWRALITLASVGAGDRVLIPGVGSGTATIAVQIAKACGASVYVTSSSHQKLASAQALGADIGVNYRESDWVEQLWDLTGGCGFAVVLDSVGSATFAIGLDLLAPGGRMITFGATSGAEVTYNVRQLYSRHLQILGTTLGSPWEFEQAFRFLTTHKIKPVIDQVFSLKDAGLAQIRLEAGLQFGKVVLEIP